MQTRISFTLTYDGAKRTLGCSGRGERPRTNCDPVITAKTPPPSLESRTDSLGVTSLQDEIINVPSERARASLTARFSPSRDFRAKYEKRNRVDAITCLIISA